MALPYGTGSGESIARSIQSQFSANDIRAVVSEHRLVPRDAQLQFRVGVNTPVRHLYHPSAVVGVWDGRQEPIEPLECYGFTLGRKRADLCC